MQNNSILKIAFLYACILLSVNGFCADNEIERYNQEWTTQSKNSSESMPLGGGDVGLNVWVENGDLLFYMQQSGAFDENNTALKAGRVRVSLNPSPFSKSGFSQKLNLEDGTIRISGENPDNKLKAEIILSTEIYRPVINVDISGNKPIQTTVTYESWRYESRELQKNESFQNSYKWAAPKHLMMLCDTIGFEGNDILFFHQNKGKTVFDVTVAQQGLDSVKQLMYNPLEELISGGRITGRGFVAKEIVDSLYLGTPYRGWTICSRQPSKRHEIKVVLCSQKSSTVKDWTAKVDSVLKESELKNKTSRAEAAAWWKKFWNRSFIVVAPSQADSFKLAEAACNYQLFRYMLGCNAYGSYPTKFNGGLFTVDPVFTKPDRAFTPDFRNWGGGTFTAQNQRLVYFPMLKSGDFDMMKPQLDFYLRLQKNAELRSQVYWGHQGACFTEQIENFGLPNPSEYGWKRPDYYDKGLEYNAWLEYQWDSSLEFCLMAILTHKYTGGDISEYIPLIKSCLNFFDEHYQYMASRRGSKKLDSNGKLVLYPGSACETYKMTKNAASTTAALQVVTSELIKLPYLDSAEISHWNGFLQRIPSVPTRYIDGQKVIAPAETWERINNIESPQLYPVFPWAIYGVGKPDLDIALNTWRLDSDVLRFRDYIGWKQYPIWAARLGLTNEAASLVGKKLGNSQNRFSAFWGPGYDWTPDHNHGGSGMIALQDMLLQTNGDSIILFPAWPVDVDVHFKLHAPDKTTVEALLKNGKIESLSVEPTERRSDVVIMINN